MSSSVWSVSIKRLLTPSTSQSRRLSFDYSHQNIKPSSLDGLFSFSLLCSFVAECVFQDLFQAETNTINFRRRQVRRFARTDSFGLGAVLVYEIPFNSSEEWTLKSAFGFEENMFNGDGMNQHELLQGIDARIAYIPLYACTSFVTGQMVNALFHNIQASTPEKTNNMDPICVPGGLGFGVDSDAFDLFDHGLGHGAPSSNSEGDCDSTNPTSSTSKNPIQVLNLTQYLIRVPDTQVAPRFRVDRDNGSHRTGDTIGESMDLVLDRNTVVAISRTSESDSSRASFTSHTETYPSILHPSSSSSQHHTCTTTTMSLSEIEVDMDMKMNSQPLTSPSSPKLALSPSEPSLTTSSPNTPSTRLSSLFSLGPSIATSHPKQLLSIPNLTPFPAQFSVLPTPPKSLMTPTSAFTTGTRSVPEPLNLEGTQIEGEYDDWELEWVEAELLLERRLGTGLQPVRSSEPSNLLVGDTFEIAHSEGTLGEGEICLNTIGDSVRFDTNVPSIPSVPLILPLAADTDLDFNPILSNLSSSFSITSSTSTFTDSDLNSDPSLSNLSLPSSITSSASTLTTDSSFSKNLSFPTVQHLRPVSSTDVAFRFRADRDGNWGTEDKRVDEHVEYTGSDYGAVKDNVQTEGGKERRGDGEKEKENIPPSALYVN